LYTPYLQSVEDTGSRDSKPFIKFERFSKIAEHFGYDCQLVITLTSFLSLIDDRSNDGDYNQGVLKQIYRTLYCFSEGYYDVVDPVYHLKVYFLLFFKQRIETFPNRGSDPELDPYFFRFAFKLYSAEFYSDKYSRLFEEIFDIDQIDHFKYCKEFIKDELNKLPPE
jgi:hypothetical protein